MIKIKTKLLLEFLSHFEFAGEYKINEARFVFNERGLETTTDIPLCVGQIHQVLYREAFEEYNFDSRELTFALDNISYVTNSLRKLPSEFVEIQIKGFLLVITGDNKELRKELIHPRCIETEFDYDLTYSNYTSLLALSQDNLKALISEANTNACEKVRMSFDIGEALISNVGKCVLDTKLKSEHITSCENTTTYMNFLNILPKVSFESIDVLYKHEFPLVMRFKKDHEEKPYLKLEIIINTVKEVLGTNED